MASSRVTWSRSAAIRLQLSAASITLPRNSRTIRSRASESRS